MGIFKRWDLEDKVLEDSKYIEEAEVLSTLEGDNS